MPQPTLRPAIVFAIAGVLLGSLAAAPARAEPVANSDLAMSEPVDGKAVLAVVSIRDQRVSLYDAKGEALRSGVSSGRFDYETPVGVYAVLQKKEQHTSNLYDDAQMPFMQRITWSGIALHAGQLPGRPASHGCVRLPHAFAEQIFPLTKLGMRVVVAYADVSPVPIVHPLLFQPRAVEEAATAQPIAYETGDVSAPSPFEPDVRKWPARQALLDSLRPDASRKAIDADAAKARVEELKAAQKPKLAERAKSTKALKRAEAARGKADERVARAEKWLETAKSKSAKVLRAAETNLAKASEAAASAEAKLAEIKGPHDAREVEFAKLAAELAAAEAAMTAAVAASNTARRKLLPVSVLVSLKTQRLYVRQGHAAVFDVPVSIAEPDRPIGTYVYTAVSYDEAGDRTNWTVVSTGPRGVEDQRGVDEYDPYSERRQKKSARSSAPPATNIVGAKDALDRITIAPETAAKLSEYVWPGSSLIVTDEEIHKETGEATDFVVLISGEPQGGIKKRPKQPPMYDYFYYDDDEYYQYQRYYDRRRRPRYTPFFSFW